jgi:hypothetical protein
MAENIVTKEILDKPFAVQQIHSTLRSMNKSRPTPLWIRVITQHKTKAERYKDFFPPLGMKS